ncbi:adenosylcobinamide-GDP ribazoletransferase [Algibacillus agarilyticus]|uniref:adenosylcobinamide-GDP ribazoletransferase n=1 Tax=Algibacillus agarilyticus TaxID=2234133 RepID=UPI000DD06AAF|nr:adenosylcobinamide-GDP ribazoletransferase [Algibacillus agarilyticus]
MNFFCRQLNLFYLALSFFTRLPIPKNVQYSAALLNQSGRYFSLIGWVLALILSAAVFVFSTFFPSILVVALIIILSLLLTGAFHEDGLADMADGIGGGMTLEKRLTIMKDSRIGTYGSVSLVCSLGLKFICLYLLAQFDYLILALIVAYPLSRALAASLIFDMRYVADLDTSKSKPLASNQTVTELLLLLMIGVAPVGLFYDAFSLSFFIYLSVCLLFFRWGFKTWLNARIGGYTGDCLGAAQQIAEIVIYLVLIASFGLSMPEVTL